MMKKLLSSILSSLFLLSATPSVLASSTPFVGEIMWVGFTFCPEGWARADGQLLSINDNQTLFSLLGTIYGGDGRTTYALPDLRGRAAFHSGQGPGLLNVPIGRQGGVDEVQLTTQHLPSHQHGAGSLHGVLVASSEAATNAEPEGRVLADGQRAALYSSLPLDDSERVLSSDQAVAISGGETAAQGQGQAFDNRPPFLAMTACIALTGQFPSRN